MQIDFHHATTYVIARFSGFNHDDASVIAYSAQYVDDSTSSGFIRFANGMRYLRSATAHPMSDPDNLDNDENTISWLPFHFLPGNLVPATAPDDEHQYARKLVCRPDSQIARDMIAAASAERDAPYALHRLGIAAHVFVDTFVHKGFAGLHHHLNTATELRDADGKAIPEFAVPPIGHGQVGTCPDQPFLRWSYTDWEGKRIVRDNPADFLQASTRLCEEFQRFRGVPIAGLSREQAGLLSHAFETIRDEPGEVRHAKWIAMIADNHFGFGPQKLEYEGKSIGSWKHIALGQGYVNWLDNCKASVDRHLGTNGDGLFDRLMAFGGKQVQSVLDKSAAAADALGRDIPIECTTAVPFLDSHYKHFHDAAKAQRYLVLNVLLPAASIYAA